MIYIGLVLGLMLFMYIFTYYMARTPTEDAITLSFSRWIKLYEVNPDNWIIYHDGGPIVKYEPSHQAINISLLTWWRFQLWKHNLYKRTLKKHQIEMTQRFLSDVQNDIDNLKKKADKQVEESLDEYIKILLRQGNN